MGGLNIFFCAQGQDSFYTVVPPRGNLWRFFSQSKLWYHGAPGLASSFKHWERSIQPVSSTSAADKSPVSTESNLRPRIVPAHTSDLSLEQPDQVLWLCGVEPHCKLKAMGMHLLISGANGQRFFWGLQWSWDLDCAFQELCHWSGYAKNRGYKLVRQLNVTTFRRTA